MAVRKSPLFAVAIRPSSTPTQKTNLTRRSIFDILIGKLNETAESSSLKRAKDNKMIEEKHNNRKRKMKIFLS